VSKSRGFLGGLVSSSFITGLGHGGKYKPAWFYLCKV
jgi:hypothetical protein